MPVTAAEVKVLRSKTGAGMMECRAALLESGGDMARAEEALKGRGLAIAKKREQRATNQGRVFGVFTDEAAVLVELRCETDFVSQNEEFIALGKRCAREAHSGRLTEPNERIEGLVYDAVALIRENILVNSIHLLEAGPRECLAGYVHDIGRIASLVKLSLPAQELRDDPRVRTLAGDLALHVTAFAPLFVRDAEIAPEYRAAYEEEYRKELAASGKPQDLVEKIVAGKWRKHLEGVCLLSQPFLRDEEISVAEAVARVSREMGASIAVDKFAYVAIAPATCL